MRYIQIKDQDMHDISECQLPEVQSQPKSKPSNNMAEDNFDGLEAALLRSTGAEWPGNWESNFGFLSHQSHTEHKSTSDFYDLTSPVWYNHTEQVPHLNLKKKTENQPDRRLRKNQDRVQNTLGSTGRKKTQGSSSQGTGVSRPWEKNGRIRCCAATCILWKMYLHPLSNIMNIQLVCMTQYVNNMHAFTVEYTNTAATDKQIKYVLSLH